MNFAKSGVFFSVILMVSGCASHSVNTMTTTVYKDGASETTYYSKYYSSVSWVIEGEVGVEVWLDHDKQVGPFYSLQQSMGWLGPGDLEADGIVTGYLVNLSATPRQVSDFRIVYGRAGQGLEAKGDIDLAPRTVTRVLPGSMTIPNYGTKVRLTAEFVLDGTEYSIPLVAERKTQQELSHLRSDFPWFQPPYFPFDPPLTNSNF